MIIKEKNINKYFILFIFLHVFVWTLIPSLSNINLPLDTIEALAWSSEIKLGYEKYPPLFPFIIEFFFKIFGNQDWVFYFLSQLLIVSSFIIIFKFSEDFFDKRIYSLISVLLLEGIFFFNFTSAELNPILCQLPFISATVFYSWKSIKDNNNTSWILFGIFAALSALTFYLSFYQLASLGLFFLFITIKYKKFNLKYLLFLISFLILFFPHLIWVFNNNFATVNYGLFRSVGDPLSGLGYSKLIDHLYYPVIFLLKQTTIVLPLFIIFLFIIKKPKLRINLKDKKFLFLISITVLPIFLMFITSLLAGVRIRTMWMASFYMFIGIFVVYIFQSSIDLKKIKNFIFALFFFAILSPALYFLTSYIEKDKRTDYPGKKISQAIQAHWDKNFSNKIDFVVGDGWVNGGWYAGNLSYHLESRPKFRTKSEENPNIGTVTIQGFNEISDCDYIFFQIPPFNDVCMSGKK